MTRRPLVAPAVTPPAPVPTAARAALNEQLDGPSSEPAIPPPARGARFWFVPTRRRARELHRRVHGLGAVLVKNTASSPRGKR
jgi:hypothetical protein